MRYFKAGLAFSLLLGFVSCQPIMFMPSMPLNSVISPSLKDCLIFPEDHIWNTPVDTLPLDPNSDAYLASIGINRSLRTAFGPTYTGGYDGIPYVVVDQSQPMVDINFVLYGHESDPGPYPIPRNAPIEDEEARGSDRHVLVVDKDTCMLYELYHAYPNIDGTWNADSGAVFDLRSYSLRPDGWTSADAAGLAILPGLVRYEEVEVGEIKHALRFTTRPTRADYVWPARHKASDNYDLNLPPMGQRFRLKEDFNIDGFSPQAKVILTALKKYGMVLADNGPTWAIFGAPDDRWNLNQLREISKLSPLDFEAIDVSSLMIHPDSARVKPPSDTKPVVVPAYNR